jgi:hypothetical protein
MSQAIAAASTPAAAAHLVKAALLLGALGVQLVAGFDVN